MATETAQAIKIGDYQSAPWSQPWFQGKKGKGEKDKGRGKSNPFADQMADGADSWDKNKDQESWEKNPKDGKGKGGKKGKQKKW